MGLLIVTFMDPLQEPFKGTLVTKSHDPPRVGRGRCAIPRCEFQGWGGGVWGPNFPTHEVAV